MANGRLPDIKDSMSKPYALMRDSGIRSDNPNDALKGNVAGDDLSRVYFSQQNVAALQQGMRYLVWKGSCEKHVIGNQSEDELRIVMRSIFLQNAKHQNFNILEQVRELNSKVLDFCVPRILGEIKMYAAYRDKVSTLPVPLDMGKNESIKGTKVLELKQF